MPVAEYDSVSPAATSEKMAPVTAPLTTRVRNLVTLGRALPAVHAVAGRPQPLVAAGTGASLTDHPDGAVWPTAPSGLTGASAVEREAVVAGEGFDDDVL